MKNSDKEVMRALRHDHGWTLADIGILFGITRERVRQIIGNTGHVSAAMRREAIQDMPYSITDSQVADMTGLSVPRVGQLRRHRPRKMAGGGPRKNQECVEYVAGILGDMGHECQIMAFREPYDILLDGRLKIAVRYGGKRENPPSLRDRLRSTRYVFRVHAVTEDTGYVILVADKDIFVIPRHMLDGKESIAFVWPTHRPTIGRYQQYHERFDLL